ncbi:protein YLS9 isoform X1 [Panicum miliaceum]|uniref:Protein YLS9 isoform X1 n=1 Tax=Panicum miliaceum TaxID=4540 RepID=A0A3L6SHS1_PANMI|nr:protein YLS9 isoform X1 [Panicum miliaceum]
MQIDSDERLEEQPMMRGNGHGRVHPAASSSDFSGEMNQPVSAPSSDPSSSPLYSFHFEKPVPQSSYVVQVPKDKVFRVPPPENARLFEHYTRRAKRRSRCSCVRVCTCLLAATLAIAFLLAAAAGVMYLVFRPRRPSYAVQALAVSGLAGVGNASAAPAAFSPGFDATVRADNPNGKIGVHYEGGRSRVSVSYDGVPLADGACPALYQGPRNVTVFVAKAKGSGIRFSQGVRGQMAAAERLRSVPFDVDVEVPVRLQLGGVKTWAVPARARCTVAVDRLAADAKVVSSSCDVKVRLLSWRN